MQEICVSERPIYAIFHILKHGNLASSSWDDPVNQKKFNSRCTWSPASVESAPLSDPANILTMKFRLFALLAAALSAFPIEAHAAVVSHMRCGVLAGYQIDIPYEYQNVQTEMDRANTIEICNSQLNSIAFSVENNSIRPVSTGSWEKNAQKSFNVVVQPKERNHESTAEEIIKTLYDKSTYQGRGGYPAKAPQKVDGLTYIQGTPLAGEAVRDDFYLSTDKNGRLNYLIHCTVAGARDNGQCLIGYKPEGLNLSLMVGISAEDIGSHQDISEKALELVQTMIKGRVLG